MDWYFIDGTERRGPVELEFLRELRRENAVLPDTLVWHKDLPSWQPYSVAVPPEPPVGEPVASAGGDGSKPYPDVLTPSSSGLDLPAYLAGTEKSPPAPPSESRSASYGTAIPSLPAAHRSPRPVHRAQSPPAGFIARVACYLADVIFIHVLAVGLGTAIVALTEITPLAIIGSSYRSFEHLPTPGMPLPGEDIGLRAGQLGLIVTAYLGLALFYYVFLVATYGATPGKRLLRYRLATTRERPVGTLRATVRHFGGVAIRLVFVAVPLQAGWVSSGQITPLALIGIAILPFGELSYFWALWDKQKRALHDHLAGTVVVRD